MKFHMSSHKDKLHLVLISLGENEPLPFLTFTIPNLYVFAGMWFMVQFST